MTGDRPGSAVWRPRRGPVLAGAAVGLATGLPGLLATSALFGSPWGGMVGAVGCGVTAVARSSGALAGRLGNAVVADVLSSIAFVLLALGSYLGYVWATEGFGALSAALAVGLFAWILVPGLVVPIAIASVGVTVIAGTLTAVVT